MKKLISSFFVFCASFHGFAQNILTFYTSGQELLSQNIKLSNWGGGDIASTDELANGPKPALRVSILNFYSGGKIMFDQPIDISKVFVDPKNMLGLEFKLGNKDLILGTPPSKPFQFKPTSPAVSKIRCVITTSDEKRSEIYLPVEEGNLKEGSYQIGVPLQAIHGLSSTNKIIKEILLTGDKAATFYLVHLGVLQDETPITGSILTPKLNLAAGDEPTFKAQGSGGYSILQYSWSYDAKNRFYVDATGKEVKRRFLKSGKYLVTLTISDRYNLKTPSTHSIEVTVNP